jgi:hypothetical protein
MFEPVAARCQFLINGVTGMFLVTAFVRPAIRWTTGSVGKGPPDSSRPSTVLPERFENPLPSSHRTTSEYLTEEPVVRADLGRGDALGLQPISTSAR